MNNIKLNEEQEKVFSAFKTGANLYVTGKGGSGKSFLMRYIIDYCQDNGRSVLVCAPTGIAALNIGGSTIHRAFGVPMGIIEPGNRCKRDRNLEVVEAADVIVIDEISMCRLDVFEFVANTILNCCTQKQLLLVGDFYQLPPILRQEDDDVYTKLYGKRLYAFESNLWKKLHLHTIELQSSMRQKEKSFVTALDHIREGIADFSVFKNKKANSGCLTICGTNDEASHINLKFLSEMIERNEKIMKPKATITGIVENTEMPTDIELTLCPDARVVMLNNDKDKRWVNGSFGTIVGCGQDTITIKIDGSDTTSIVERYTWKFLDYEVEEKKGKKKLHTIERGAFEQFPVRLAWAITIHKSQGQTYERVNVSTRNIFAEGQLYVALSRCKTLDGMHIEGNLADDKVITSDVVKRFMSSPNDFTPEDYSTQSSGTEDRYKIGYDDGYKDGTEETKLKYMERLANDPGVKVLSDYTRRQKELAAIEDPKIRNPKGAGRKPKEPGQKLESKAVRVPLSIFEYVKKLGDLAKRDKTICDRLKKFLETELLYAK